MVVLVSYDVNTQDAAGKRRLRRIARLCTSWGQRVQFSVFEACSIMPNGRSCVRSSWTRWTRNGTACASIFWGTTGEAR